MSGGRALPGAPAQDALVCLVSMPFMPAFMPALGPSLLKAGLAREGIGCDLYYGSLELIDLMAESSGADEACLDYSFVASAEDLGDAFFARSLWPEQAPPVAELLEQLPLAPHLPFERLRMVEIAARLLELLPQADAFLERCLQARDWARYRVVGFSSTFCQTVASLALARLIKRVAPDVTIVFGGANCEGEMGVELLRCFPCVDHVLQGEADLTFPRYVRRLLAGEPCGLLPGLLVRDAEGAVVRTAPASMVTDLDALALPDFGDYLGQRPAALAQVPLQVPVETSRGCWWGAVQHCVFCGLNPSGMTYRSKRPDRAVETFLDATQRWDAASIVVVDNILDMDYFSTVLPRLVGLGVPIFCETKSNLREEQVALLAAAGVIDIQPGIESLNTAALRHMRKGARAATQLELLKWCRTYAVTPLWFYLYGFPGEDDDWYAQDVGLMHRLVHLPPPGNPNPVVIDRFSPLHKDPEAFGLRDLRPSWNAHLSYAGLSSESRARLAYHFEAEGGPGLAYEQSLWSAVRHWQARYRAGAHLWQAVGDDCTLVLDGRGARKRAYLLSGLASRVHTALRRAQPLDRLPTTGTAEAGLTSVDLGLSLRAAELGAELVSGTDAAQALEVLDARGLVVSLDGRWLALAVDEPGWAAPRQRHEPLLQTGVT